MKNIKNIALSFFYVAVVLFGAFVPTAAAEETAVTDNGATSTNTVNVTQVNTTTINQTNTTNATNNVTTNTNTGGNTASDNTGGQTEVKTGDAFSSTAATNTGNVSVADVSSSCNCTEANNSVVVSGNGASSFNTVNQTNATNTHVTTSNIANVVNNVVTNSNTGKNAANDNNGNVKIVTGQIGAQILLLNGPLNISKVTVGTGKNVESLLKIAGNGVSSINAINGVDINNVTISENNIVNLFNNVVNNLNTGGNTASFNNGDVAILTGDVFANVQINNLANINDIVVDCGCKEKTNEKPTIPPIVTSSTSSGGSSSSSSSPQVQGASASMSQSLPTTGGSWLLFALIGNVLTFFLGAYLRLRSGRSPAAAFAY